MTYEKMKKKYKENVGNFCSREIQKSDKNNKDKKLSQICRYKFLSFLNTRIYKDV